MACHIRFMKKGARIGLTETNLASCPATAEVCACQGSSANRKPWK
jgi:enoyl-CoA hydratase/carnithine racemase